MRAEVRPYRDDDAEVVTALRREAFRRPTRLAGWRRGGFVLTLDGSVRAILLVERERQWFGGRPVPVAVITSVAVEPLWRGRGLLGPLMAGVFGALRAEGIPLALLYPSTLGAYRRCGFEVGGYHVRHRAALAEVPAPELEVELAAWDDAELPEVLAAYGRTAAERNGWLDRSETWWRERVLDPGEGPPIYRYLARQQGEVTGHVTFRQESLPGGHGYRFDVVCGDLVWADAASARSLLALLGWQRPIATEFTWVGPPDEPLLALADRLNPTVVQLRRWFARLIDPAAALMARGYPPQVTASVELALTDPLLAQPTAIRLEVAGGRAQVTPIPTARLSTDIGALAALFTGGWHAREAARAGRLANATPADLDALAACFAGPSPWLIEAV